MQDQHSNIVLSIHGTGVENEYGDILGCRPSFSTTNFPAVIETDIEQLQNFDQSFIPRISEIEITDMGKSIPHIPKIVWQCPNLQRLTVCKKKLILELFKKSIPKQIKILELDGVADINLPENFTHSNIDTLILNNADLFIDIKDMHFPNLQAIEIHYDLPFGDTKISKQKSKKIFSMWQDISNLKNLQSIKILNLPKYLNLSDLPKSVLRLVLLRASIKNLSDLQTLSKLEYIKLDNMLALTDLDGIEKLKCLKELYILDCHKIKSLDPVIKIKTLKTVNYSFISTKK